MEDGKDLDAIVGTVDLVDDALRSLGHLADRRTREVLDLAADLGEYGDLFGTREDSLDRPKRVLWLRNGGKVVVDLGEFMHDRLRPDHPHLFRPYLSRNRSEVTILPAATSARLCSIIRHS